MRRVATLGLSLLLGCTSVEDGAKENYAQAYSCPMERVEIRKRPDIRPSQVSIGGPPKPPADVAADPGRLAVWQRDENERAAKLDDYETVYELRGCDHQVLWVCARATSHVGGNGIACFPGDYPPGASKW